MSVNQLAANHLSWVPGLDMYVEGLWRPKESLCDVILPRRAVILRWGHFQVLQDQHREHEQLHNATK